VEPSFFSSLALAALRFSLAFKVYIKKQTNKQTNKSLEINNLNNNYYELHSSALVIAS